MYFHELPDKLILQVFKDLPEFVLYQLLKSSTCAKQAYAVYYQYVYLTNDETYASLKSLQPKYLNSYKAKGMEAKFKDRLKRYIAEEGGIPVFHSARHLMNFYRNNPLFIPHTLVCIYIEDFVALEEIKPGFLRKFKHHVCTREEDSQLYTSRDTPIIKEILSQDFSVYKTDKASIIPEHVTSLSIGSEPKRALKDMPSVKHLESQFSSLTNDILRKVPNVKGISGELDDSVRLEDVGRHLTKVTLAGERPVDLSGIHSLQNVTLKLEKEHSVGFSSDCSHRLPLGVKTLSLTVFDCSQVHLQTASHLKSLCIDMRFSCYHERDVGKLQLPCGLVELEALFENRPCTKLLLPSTIKRVSMKGSGATSFGSLPVSITHLNLGDRRASGLEDLSQLTNLVSLVLNNELLPYIKFPPNLVELELKDHHNVDPMASLTKLKYLSHSFTSLPSARIAAVGPSVTHLTLEKANIQDLVGCEKLIALELAGCKCPNDMSNWELTNLQSLSCEPAWEWRDLPYKLPSPPSLRYLSLKGFQLEEKLICATNLNYLSLEHCEFNQVESPCIQINEELEVLSIKSVKGCLDVFSNLSKHLKHIFIHHEEDFGEDFDVDFTSTDLEEFVDTSVLQGYYKVKFPKTLRHLTLHRRGAWEWIDLSQCSQFCSFEDEDYNDHWCDTDEKKALVDLRAQIARLQNKHPSY